MKRVLGVVAFGCALSGVDSKLVRWAPDKREDSWAPAQETLGVMPDLMNNGISPRPTAAPEAPERNDLLKAKRASTDNTCAYIDGDSASSLYCPATDRCVYNSVRSAIGCCEDGVTVCPVWTTCYDRTDSSKYTTSNGYTLLCGQSSFPNCIKYLYQDAVFTGYTLYGCAVNKATSSVYYQPTRDSGTTTARTTTPRTTPRTTTSPTTTSTDPNAASTGPVDSGTTTLPGFVPTRSADSSASSSPAIGPIVGGVVGGVAALGLLGLVLFLVLRKKGKPVAGPAAAATAASAGAPAPGAGGPPGGAHDSQAPQMAQHQQMAPQGQYPIAGFASYDPRASIAKPPYVQQTAYDAAPISPPGSPSPGPGSPAPAYQVATAGHTPNTWNQPNASPANSAYAPPQAYPVVQHNTGYQQQPQQQPAQQNYQQPQHTGQHQQQPAHNQGHQQGQTHGTYYAELPTQRGDGEVRELA